VEKSSTSSVLTSTLNCGKARQNFDSQLVLEGVWNMFWLRHVIFMHSISYALVRTDMDAFSEYLFRVRIGRAYWIMQRVVPPFFWLLAISVVLLEIVLWRQGRVNGASQAVIPVVLVTLSITLSFWRRLYFAFNWKQLQHQPGFGKTATVQLQEKGVHIQHFGGEAFLLWSIFPKIARDEGHLFILLSRNSALIIRDEAFSTREQALQFSQFAQGQWQLAHPTPDSPPLAAP
jgi:hypothetical protein